MPAREPVRPNGENLSLRRESNPLPSGVPALADTSQVARRAAAGRAALRPADVLVLQRMVGNQAVQQLLRNARTPDTPTIQPDALQASPPTIAQRETERESRPPSPVTGFHSSLTISSTRPHIQRNEESAELLTELATPQAFPGPDIKLQQSIVTSLEEEIAKPENEKWNNMLLYLGSVELTEPVGDDFDAIVENAEMVDSPDNAIVPEKGFAKERLNGFGLVEKAGQKENIILNTLLTMKKAKQLEYLKESGLINEDWKVVIEIHYYRERSKTGHLFHKDTLGQTLFVNLNYNNSEEIAGPEFLINPPSVEEHDLQIEETLPPVFLADLKTVKERLPKPDMIETVTVPSYGVVAFVDEAIHHMTPMVGHRSMRSGEIDRALTRLYPDEYGRAKSAYDEYNKQWGFRAFPYWSYLDTNLRRDSNMWYALIEMAKAGVDAKFDRTDFEKAGVPTTMIDELLRMEGGQGFREVSIPDRKVSGMERPNKGVTIKSDVDVRKKALKRRMSMLAQKGKLPSMGGKEKRSFFRTWVRSVPKAKG